MTDAFTKLSDADLGALIAGLQSGRIVAPFTELQVSRVVTGNLGKAIASGLSQLESVGFSAEQIAAFKKEMEAAGADYKFINYSGVKHSFTNPDADKVAKKFNLPLAYDADADRKSWEAMQQFFNELFKP